MPIGRIKLYHNPKCGTSRQVKALLEEKGQAVEVIDYLNNPLNKKELEVLANKIDDSKNLLRAKEPLAKELNLFGASTNDLIEALAANPILLNRPIVETQSRAIAARPAERALELL